ncbi:hypothetical protein [Dysgonomonas reticulitermitis]
MKKFIYILSFVAALFSCSEDKIPVPEGLFIEEANLTFVAEGETYLNRFYTTAESVTIEVPDAAKDWLSVTVKDKHLEIVTQPNVSISPRNSTVAVKSKERVASLAIAQAGLPTRKLVITGGSCSSAQSSEGSFRATYDGDPGTYWHSEYSPSSKQYQDHWLLYNVEDASGSLDLIMIYSRVNNGAANGRWGYFSIWVKGDGTDVPSTIEDASGVDWDGWGGDLGSVDADGFKLLYKGNDVPNIAVTHVTTVVLPVSVANPKSVKFVLKGSAPNGSRNGHGSVGEIELFGKVQ